MAWAMLPVPPVVTRPAGVVPSTASAWRRSRVMAMISASNLVELGHMSRWSELTWAKSPKALVQEVVVVVVAAVHRPRALPGLPEGVLLLRHHLQLAEDLLAARPPSGRRRWMSKRSWYGNVLMAWCPPVQEGGRVARPDGARPGPRYGNGFPPLLGLRAPAPPPTSRARAPARPRRHPAHSATGPAAGGAPAGRDPGRRGYPVQASRHFVGCVPTERPEQIGGSSLPRAGITGDG